MNTPQSTVAAMAAQSALTAAAPPATSPAAPYLALGAQGAMPVARLLRAYLNETRYEVLRMARTPIFVIMLLVLPVALFLLVGVALAGSMTSNPQPSGGGAPALTGADLASIMFVSMSTMAVAMSALFGVGQVLAVEREQGLLRLKRAQPVPTGAYLIAKVLMQLIFAALSVCAIAITALLLSKISFSVVQILGIAGVLTAGSIPLIAIGLFVGSYASGKTAPGFLWLAFFPMMYLSGMFFPLSGTLAMQEVLWPTFHLTQLAYAIAGVKQAAVVPPLMSVGFLAGWTVICGGLALHKLARKG